MEPRFFAIAIPVVLVLYLAVIDWVDLFPWNDLSGTTPRERLIGTAVNYVPVLLISVAFLQNVRWAMIAATAGSCLFFAGHIQAWWWPYFFGSSEEMRAHYRRMFGRTIHFLPPRGENIIPDAEHCVVAFLGASMVVACFLALRY